MSTNVLVAQGIALGGQTLNASRAFLSKGICSRLLNRNYCLYPSLPRKCQLTSLLRKESPKEVQFQIILESYQVRKNILAYYLVYFESFQNRFIFCKMIKIDMLFAQEITSGSAISNAYRILPSKGKCSDLLSRN